MNRLYKRYCIWGLIGLVFLLVFFFVLPLFLPYLLCNVYHVSDATSQSNTMQNYGLIGDSYGTYNALFSALALGGVVITLYFQKKSNDKNTLIDKFYKMLDFQHKLIDDLEILPVTMCKKDELRPIKGRASFVQYKIQLKYLMKAVSEISDEKNLQLKDPDVADIAYSVFYYGSSVVS